MLTGKAHDSRRVIPWVLVVLPLVWILYLSELELSFYYQDTDSFVVLFSETMLSIQHALKSPASSSVAGFHIT